MDQCNAATSRIARRKTTPNRERLEPPFEVRDGQVSFQLPLPLAEILADSRGAIERLAGEVGVLIARAVLEEEVNRRAGAPHNREEDAPYRWGHRPGFLVLGGQKVGLRRPRLRQAGREAPLETYAHLQADGPLQRAAQEKMLRGVSTRNYAGVVQDFVAGYGIKKSSVSRHFVVASAKQVAELCERRLEDLGLVALMVDGKQYTGHAFIVALGIDEEGRKHTLGLWDGATENAEVCGALLDDLMRRGLNPEGPYLFVIDGSKALHKAVRQRFGEESPIQRCQVHKTANVCEHLPEKWKGMARLRMNAAYGMNSYEEARDALRKTESWLRGISDGAANSLQEGLEETLTLHRLEVPVLLRKSLSSTNVIESCLSIVGELTSRVKRWKGVSMVRRWMGTALLEAERKFRRIRGYKSMALLMSALTPQRAVAVQRRTG